MTLLKRLSCLVGLTTSLNLLNPGEVEARRLHLRYQASPKPSAKLLYALTINNGRVQLHKKLHL